MKTKLIKTENYLLIVEDEQYPNLQLGVYYICKDLSAIAKITKENRSGWEAVSTNNKGLSFLYCQAVDVYKIISHKPLNNYPILRGLGLIPTVATND